MMNKMQVFTNEQFGQVRTLLVKGEPWFVAADVCRTLGINNSRMAVSRLDDDEKGVILTDTPGGKQEMTAINEPGLYALVLGSRKPEAKQFKRWITHEVIPSIRKHGAYMTKALLEQAIEDPEAVMAIAKQLVAERSEKDVFQAQLAIAQPVEKGGDSAVGSAH